MGAYLLSGDVSDRDIIYGLRGAVDSSIPRVWNYLTVGIKIIQVHIDEGCVFDAE